MLGATEEQILQGKAIKTLGVTVEDIDTERAQRLSAIGHIQGWQYWYKSFLFLSSLSLFPFLSFPFPFFYCGWSSLVFLFFVRRATNICSLCSIPSCQNFHYTDIQCKFKKINEQKIWIIIVVFFTYSPFCLATIVSFAIVIFLLFFFTIFFCFGFGKHSLKLADSALCTIVA